VRWAPAGNWGAPFNSVHRVNLLAAFLRISADVRVCASFGAPVRKSRQLPEHMSDRLPSDNALVRLSAFPLLPEFRKAEQFHEPQNFCAHFRDLTLYERKNLHYDSLLESYRYIYATKQMRV
jgi:hypothetical protein